MRRSRQITLLFSGALATMVGQSGCTPAPPPAPPPDAGTPIVSELEATSNPNRALANNTYTPGLGYYQSYYHRWYPYPLNFFFPSRGYFWGGGWNPLPLRGLIPPSSIPSAEAFERARNAYRYGTPYYSSGGWGGGGWGNSWGGGHSYWGGYNSESSGSSWGSWGGGESEGISHGGFGESGHGSGGGHGGS
jgi:hypothetical protein